MLTDINPTEQIEQTDQPLVYDQPQPIISIALLDKMTWYRQHTTAADFANLSPSGEKTQLKHQHRQQKIKGGHAPRDYSAVETFVDFCAALDRGEYLEALPLYYRLLRITGVISQ